MLKRSRTPLSVSNLSFSYGSKDVLKNFSMKVSSSKITAVIGKSGSGKSSFLRLVSGAVSSSFSGLLRIFGRPRLLSKADVAYVSQHPSMFPELSIEHNVLVCANLLGVSSSDGLKQAGLLASELGLDVSFNRTPQSLSGGQRVRLNILLSLLHNPTLLLLDEPFVGLDFATRRMLWQFLHRQVAKKKTVLLTTHLLSEASEFADRVVILRDGKVFFQGTPEAFQKKLNVSFVYEARLSSVSSAKQKLIEGYCASKGISVLEISSRHLFVALSSHQSRSGLHSFLSKHNISFSEVSFREPNLDEVFMCA